MSKNPTSKEVQKVFDAYPKPHRKKMLALRSLLFDVAKSIGDVGEIEETLKWGEPSYLTSASKSGTTIRIDWKSKNPNYYAMYFNCQTNLVERFRKDYPDDFEFEGDRGIMFPVDQPIPVASLSKCVAAALTYHRDKRKSGK